MTTSKEEDMGLKRTKEKSDQVYLIVHGIPRGTRSKFKSICIEKETSMKAEILHMIQRFIKKNTGES